MPRTPRPFQVPGENTDIETRNAATGRSVESHLEKEYSTNASGDVLVSIPSTLRGRIKPTVVGIAETANAGTAVYAVSLHSWTTDSLSRFDSVKIRVYDVIGGAAAGSGVKVFVWVKRKYRD